MRRIASEKGIDLSKASSNGELPSELIPFYKTIYQSELYSAAVGRSVLRHGELLSAFDIWRTGKNRQNVQQLVPILRSLPLPTGDGPAFSLTDYFPVLTSQEADALVCSASDGKRGTRWRNEIARERRV